MSTVSFTEMENLLQMSKLEMSAKKVTKAAKTRTRKYLLQLKKLCDIARKDLLVKDPVAPVEAAPVEVAPVEPVEVAET
jgi:hypothetical protein